MEAVTIHYVLSGTGTLRTPGGVDAAYAPNNIIVVPARVAQSLGKSDPLLGEADATEYCGLLADGLVRFTAGDGTRDSLIVCATVTASYGGALGVFDQLRGPVVSDLPHNTMLHAAFAQMLQEVANPGIGTQALIEALMKQCLILLLRHHLENLSISSPFFAVLVDHRLAQAVADVLRQPSAPHSVESLAIVAAMSRSTFAEQFVAAFGQTPIDFVQQVRLRRGAELLRGTDLPIKVIASSVGYASRSYFTRAFRKLYTMDPRSFRERAALAESAMLLGAPTVAERIAGALDQLLGEPS